MTLSSLCFVKISFFAGKEDTNKYPFSCFSGSEAGIQVFKM